MKPFRFNLHALRTLRQRKEQQRMELYATALHHQRQALVELQAVQAELEAAWSEWNAALSEGCAGSRLVQTQNYFQSVEIRRQACLGAVRQSEREVQETLQAMLFARQEREAVDAFFDTQRLQYDRELQREERKVLDEMAQRRPAVAMIWSAAKPVTHD